MKYAELGMKTRLLGVESIDGVNAYGIEVETATGKKSTSYYSVENNLKIRQVAVEGGQTIVTNLSDYKEVDGLMFPHKTSMTGVAPVPLDMTLESIKVNKGIDPAVFKVD